MFLQSFLFFFVFRLDYSIILQGENLKRKIKETKYLKNISEVLNSVCAENWNPFE